MRVRSLIVPFAIACFVIVQVLLLRQLLGDTSKFRAEKASRQERKLDEQLSILHANLADLKTLNSRLGETLTGLGVPDPAVPAAAQPALKDASTVQAAITAGSSVDADTALEDVGSKSISLASLAEAIRGSNEAAAAEKEAAADPASFPTAAADGTILIFPSGNEDGECVGGGHPAAAEATAAVVTVTFDRADYLKRHLDSLLAVHGRDADNRRKFPLFISQDGSVPKATVANLAKSFGSRGVAYLHHKEEAPPKRLLNPRENLAYYRIANHYKFIMRTFFDCFGFRRLIILEDDMELAPDFFPYFEATAAMLATDPTLFCVSSWNDHGQAQFVRDETALFRSDFFPGLGWMLGRDFWLEIRGEWPKSYWDDWMRLNKTRKGRQCIRPEVCRTYNFGAKGSSRGFYYKRFLAPIRLSTADVDWSRMDLSYLEQPRYDADLNATLAAAKPVTTVDEAKAVAGDVVLRYDSQEHYETLTGRLGMLREWKDGVPRGGYKGVVTVRWEKARLFLAPAPTFRSIIVDSNATQVKVDATGAVVRGKSRISKYQTS